MTATAPHDSHSSHGLRADLMLVAFLIAFDVAARLLPHMPNLTPIAASAVFAATVLRHRALAFAVPLGALAISDLALGFDGWRITAVLYLAALIPALLPMLSARLRKPGMFAPVMVASSLSFFAVTNLGVWAFSGMYPRTLEGLAACYVAALPFLQNTVVGDLLWAVALFGGAWLVRKATARGAVPAGAISTAR